MLASSSLAAASDPGGAVSDLATLTGTEIASPPSASTEPEVTTSTEQSLSAEVTASSEPQVTTSTEPSLSLGVEPPAVPAAGEPPVEPLPAPGTLLALVTQRVADQLAAAQLPDANEFVGPSTSLDNLPLLSTETPDIFGIADVAVSVDAGDVLAVLLAPAAQPSTEPIDGTDGPGTAQPWTFSLVVIDDRDADGEPARPDAVSETVLNSTVPPLAAERGRYREGAVASVAVPRIAAVGGGGSGAGTSISDPQFGAILAVLAGAAVWRLLALRTPPNPTGTWVLLPVPPG